MFQLIWEKTRWNSSSLFGLSKSRCEKIVLSHHYYSLIKDMQSTAETLHPLFISGQSVYVMMMKSHECTEDAMSYVRDWCDSVRSRFPCAPMLLVVVNEDNTDENMDNFDQYASTLLMLSEIMNQEKFVGLGGEDIVVLNNSQASCKKVKQMQVRCILPYQPFLLPQMEQAILDKCLAMSHLGEYVSSALHPLIERLTKVGSGYVVAQ